MANSRKRHVFLLDHVYENFKVVVYFYSRKTGVRLVRTWSNERLLRARELHVCDFENKGFPFFQQHRLSYQSLKKVPLDNT